MDVHPLIAALGFGALHALTPCAHSWPVLLPLVGRAKSGARPGLFFGAGMLVSSVVVGAVVGGFGGLVFGEAGVIAEQIIGVVIVLLGAALLFRPGWMHAGHVHGSCAPEAPSEDPACHHAGHRPFRFSRFGPDAGVVLLGIANMAVPCWSNGFGISLAVESGDARAGALLLGSYGLAAGVTTVALLVLVRHGIKLTDRLSSPRFEALILRGAGLLMLIYGLTLVFHIGHDHGTHG